MSVPPFTDIAKAANDLLNKDFYHLSAGTLEVRSNTPNNVAFKVTGKSSHEKSTVGAIEGKYTDKSLGTSPNPNSHRHVKRRSSGKHRTAKSLPLFPDSGSRTSEAHTEIASGKEELPTPAGPVQSVQSEPTLSSSPATLASSSLASSSSPSSPPSSSPPSSSPPSSSSSPSSPPSSSPSTPQPRPRKHARYAHHSAPNTTPTISIVGIGGGIPRYRHPVQATVVLSPTLTTLLMCYSRAGLTVTQAWNTANALESKVELADSLAKGVKAEGIFAFFPATQARGAKFNLHFKQAGFHGRAFFDLLKGPTAVVDAVIGHDGFLAGASAGYDVNKAVVTSYSAAIGYQAPSYSAAVTAYDNLSVFAASYHHKVNSQVEAAAKAIWNSKSGNTVGLEVATKYRLDPLSFVKAKINDRGVAAVGYNVLLREGVTFGIGASFDTQKLDQATHKVGTSFTFQA